MTPAVPNWKFWHPLPLWQALVIGLVTQLVIVVPVQMLNGGLQLGIPAWLPSGVAGVVMYLAIRKFAQRKLAAEAGSPR